MTQVLHDDQLVSCSLQSQVMNDDKHVSCSIQSQVMHDDKHMYQLTPEMIEECRSSFDMIDKDGDGAISLDEFKDMMKSFGGDLTNEELQCLIKEHDMDQSGEIEFEEFIEMVRKMKADGDGEDSMRLAFNAFDQDRNGTISATEMREVMTKLGQSMTDEEIKEMICEADIDGDGQISYKEFVRMYNEIS